MRPLNFYKIVSAFTAVLFAFLFFQMFFKTEKFITDLGLDFSLSLEVICKRASVFMIAFSVLLFMVINLKNSLPRQAIALSLTITMLGLASLGYYEFSRGVMNTSIFTAIFIELLVGVSFLFIFIKSLKGGSV